MPSAANSLHTGILLVAPPMLIDPNFRRTVVLLCEHNDNGSFGLILNRRLELQLKDVLEEVSPYDDSLCLGGPVEPNTLHFIHCREEIPDAIPVVDGLYWGGDFEVIKDMAKAGSLTNQDARFFLGYAGWSQDQLMNELNAGGWILAEADPRVIFRDDPERLWRNVLRSMGGDYAILANYPDDPRMN